MLGRSPCCHHPSRKIVFSFPACFGVPAAETLVDLCRRWWWSSLSQRISLLLALQAPAERHPPHRENTRSRHQPKEELSFCDVLVAFYQSWFLNYLPPCWSVGDKTVACAVLLLRASAAHHHWPPISPLLVPPMLGDDQASKQRSSHCQPACCWLMSKIAMVSFFGSSNAKHRLVVK